MNYIYVELSDEKEEPLMDPQEEKLDPLEE